MRLRVERCLHFAYIAALPYLIAKGVLFVGEKENLAVWAAVHMGGGPRDDHRLNLHPPTNRFLTERACYIFRHSCSPESVSTQHRSRHHGPKPVNVASLLTGCPHASHEASGIGTEGLSRHGDAIKAEVMSCPSPRQYPHWQPSWICKTWYAI